MNPYALRRYLRPVTRWLQFFLINSFYVDGPRSRLITGKNCAFNNAIFNTSSGAITIEDNVIFGYSVMLLTGRDLFEKGVRKSLSAPSISSKSEVPECGFDISIGNGCWIASGVIIIGGVTLGRNCQVYAGSVVTRSFPDGSILAGNPAKQLHV